MEDNGKKIADCYFYVSRAAAEATTLSILVVNPR